MISLPLYSFNDQSKHLMYSSIFFLYLERFALDDVSCPTYNRDEVSVLELFDGEFIVSKLRVAILVPPGSAKRVHTDRPGHGFAFSVGSTTSYHFDSGKTLTCQPGQCVYLPKGSNYTVETEEETGNVGLVGTYAINFHLIDDDIPYEPFLMNIRGKDKIQSLFVKAETAWRKKYIGFREDCYSALYQLVRTFKSERSSYSRLDAILQKLAPALQYIEANYTSEAISLPHLAQLCGISEPHLRKLFNAAFSVSPAIYIRNMRLNYAKELLCAGEYSITSVAALSGFNSVVYFSREFKKATGVSPNKYVQ